MSLEHRISKRILDLNIDVIGYREAIAKVVAWGKGHQHAYVCFANVHMTIEAYEDKSFALQVNQASLVVADGMPLVKLLQSFYGYPQERIAGMDFLVDVIRVADVERLKVFFFGTTPEILERIGARTSSEFPNVQVVGLFSPPFDRPLDDASYDEMINQSGAHLVFIALGCPKQEKWMAHHSHKINAPLLGVGGAFPVYAGITKELLELSENSASSGLTDFFRSPADCSCDILKPIQCLFGLSSE